jgi:membrane protein DedA with SNARE-associated domain
MANSIQEIVSFISEYSKWTLAIIFLVSFGESFAFVSFLFPGTAIMVAAGTLIPSGIIPLWPVLVGAVAGATLGDFISYWIGYRFGPVLETHWPFVSHPHLLANGHALFEKHGALSVFIGRFLGPLRAVVPLVAGSLQMPVDRFLIANVASAIIWAPALLFVGWLTITAIGALRLAKALELPISIGIFIMVAVGLAVARRYRAPHGRRQ